jgi:predicted CopG family antitoxin
MPNITLSVPPEVYKKMKEHSEIRWSEVARRAIIEYLERLEKDNLELPARDILKMLGKDFEKKVTETPLERYERSYKKAREEEWERTKSFTTRT